MTKSIINLTMPLVVSEIEHVLEGYPHHPYQQAFANPDLHQELIAYVLTHIHSEYVAINEGIQQINTIQPSIDLAETQSCLDSFIHQGIHSILEQHQASTDFQMPEENDGYLAASHWFG